MNAVNNPSAAPIALIVDDDRDIRETLGQIMESEGYAVVGAADGRQALDHLAQAPMPASLILLDIMMPGMNGVQFRVAQKANPRWSEIPTIVMTAASVEQIVAMGMLMDGAHYLRKPVALLDLVGLVTRCCPVTR